MGILEKLVNANEILRLTTKEEIKKKTFFVRKEGECLVLYKRIKQGEMALWEVDLNNIRMPWEDTIMIFQKISKGEAIYVADNQILKFREKGSKNENCISGRIVENIDKLYQRKSS